MHIPAQRTLRVPTIELSILHNKQALIVSAASVELHMRNIGLGRRRCAISHPIVQAEKVKINQEVHQSTRQFSNAFLRGMCTGRPQALSAVAVNLFFPTVVPNKKQRKLFVEGTICTQTCATNFTRSECDCEWT